MTQPDDPDTAAPDAADAPSGRFAPVSFLRVVMVVLVAVFFGGAVAYALTQDRPPGPESVDIGFLQDMTTHHEQAVQIAQLAVANGENPSVRIFAEEVILAQRWELGRMYQMLRDRGAAPAIRDQAMEWMDMPVPPAAMPGLATSDQVAALRNGSGAEADALFLDLMAEHHRGGAHMAGYAAQNADDASVRDLATVMERNQSLEIAEYRQAAERLGYDIEIEPFDPQALDELYGG